MYMTKMVQCGIKYACFICTTVMLYVFFFFYHKNKGLCVFFFKMNSSEDPLVSRPIAGGEVSHVRSA